MVVVVVDALNVVVVLLFIVIPMPRIRYPRRIFLLCRSVTHDTNIWNLLSFRQLLAESTT